MKLLRLYHISLSNLGEEIDIEPKVPDRIMRGEDELTERVCSSTSILDCIRATFMLTKIENVNEKDYQMLHTSRLRQYPFYVYYLDCPIEDIIQPRISQVPDGFITNEFWVTKTFTWKLLDVFYIRKGIDIDPFYSVWVVQINVFSDKFKLSWTEECHLS